MLDTNILIYLMKNRPQAVAKRIDDLDEDADLCMSFFTYAELLKGADKSTRKESVLKQLEQLTRIVPVNFNSGKTLCVFYAEHFNRLKSAGTPIGANDLWIASHALAERAVLVTNNVQEFERIQGLEIENWVA